ncbi:MAG: MFS transporter [Spirochaetaceae bacterium]
MESRKKITGKKLTGSLGYMVTLGVIAKFFIDISVQLFNPFLTIIAAGMGVSVVTMGRLVSVKNLMGLSAPLLGSLADKIGYRAVMRLGLLLAGTGFILLSTGAGLPFIVAGMVVSGIGQAGYAPMIQAYLSAELPYEKRSRYLGILEYSWALAGIIGLFLIGYLIEWFNWRVPLYILATGFFGMNILFLSLPRVEQKQKSNVYGGEGSRISLFIREGFSRLTNKGGKPSPSDNSSVKDKSAASDNSPASFEGLTQKVRTFFYLGKYRKSAWAAISINFFNFFAATHVMIIHGGWLENEYGLGAGQLGTVALLLGFTDWGASILVSIYGDKIGKKRSVLIGTGGMALFFALMPLLNVSLPLALIALSLPRFFFEFAIVSNFPLISEQYPEERGKVMAFSFSIGLIGPVVSGITGPAMYLRWGVWGLGPVSFASAMVSILLLLLCVKEEPHARR